MDPHRYLSEIKAKIVASLAVSSITIAEEHFLPDRGYFRARLTLSNRDFLEVAEYFVVEQGRCVTRRYRYQWMDDLQQVLKKRWDNVEHFPGLPNYPHHIHEGEESQVVSGRVLSIVELIDIIEHEVLSR
jgi:hypothetical protein